MTTKIKTDVEYEVILGRLASTLTSMSATVNQCRHAGMSHDEIQRVLNPQRCFRDSIIEDIAEYESRLKPRDGSAE